MGFINFFKEKTEDRLEKSKEKTEEIAERIGAFFSEETW